MSAPLSPGVVPGRLLLVPAPLDFGCAEPVPLEDVLPARTLREAARLQYWIAENAKTARAYLKRVDALYPLAQPLQALHIAELPRAVHKQGDHAGGKGGVAGFDARELLRPALEGHDVGLVSEAGMPGVADPGSSVVRSAHQLGMAVLPLSGPVSLLLALAASGLNGQSFAFIGYLPQEEGARAAQLHKIEAHARRSGQAQIFIETPYRNGKLWQALLAELQPDTWLSVSAGLSLPQARSESRSVAQWRKRGGACPADGRTPAVFALGC
ncbi:ribosomal RNA small subunit methyltransferase I [Corticibacter populi]|uniref:Ribosomal RNA small subunit methyltransferase I n=1 Tax=Corticibacter populi TaxID=1550736 RepID=A0A3M6QKJ6_9BURK|nr:SAM-dependent methyltransferase [Corticibacter populi]RMX02982.1 ribosomal RNA small subunit methyltransferase I [Corticibacter populi]RZS33407.1 16S rRNA (cytidine1402-2'-O)-methyltransferase [Corticibacter populi]